VAATNPLRALGVLVGRRLALTAHSPRQVLAPLANPILFPVVVAPAIGATLGAARPGVDYTTFVAVGTVGLLVAISCVFSGLAVIVDRDSGALRELLAAPIHRSVVVAANFAVALLMAGLQIAVLFAAAVLRGAHLRAEPSGLAWFGAAAVLFAVFMYATAEILANRIPTQEDYVGAVPALALLPWFFAGSLFPIRAMPAGLAAFAKLLPLTHALALMRYGLVAHGAGGLHDIWGMTDAGAMAGLSLLVVAGSAAALTALAVRVFTRSAVG
jgi:ABC-2 type transport system permease protein